MTGVSVTGIFGLKWFSRYPPSPLPLSLWLWQEIYKHFLLWKHTFVADTGWINEFVSGYLRLISLIFQRSLMCDLKTNPRLMEGQGCVLVIFFKYLSPAYSSKVIYYNNCSIYSQQMFLFYHLFIYFVFTIHSAMLPKLKSLPLQHDSAPRDCNPSWPVETPAFERNFVSASRVAPDPSRGARGCKHSAFSGRGSWLKSETSRER